MAEDSEDEAFGSVVLRAPSDGYAAGLAGLPTLTITCRDERGFASGRLTERSLSASEEFCLELIRRLDAEVGTELSADR